MNIHASMDDIWDSVKMTTKTKRNSIIEMNTDINSLIHSSINPPISIRLAIHPTINPSIHPSIHPSIACMHFYLHPSIKLSTQYSKKTNYIVGMDFKWLLIYRTISDPPLHSIFNRTRLLNPCLSLEPLFLVHVPQSASISGKNPSQMDPLATARRKHQQTLWRERRES